MLMPENIKDGNSVGFGDKNTGRSREKTASYESFVVQKLSNGIKRQKDRDESKWIMTQERRGRGRERGRNRERDR